MRILAGTGVALLWLPLVALAGTPPSFTAQFLGPANNITSMNESAMVVGWATLAGNSRAFVAGPDHPYEVLPLPVGMVSSRAEHINDAGVIVGAAGPFYAPEYYFQSRAVKWTPDGQGGWIITDLGRLPGHVSSLATSINNLGEMVGFSYSGMFRLPVLFEPDGPVDLSATGIFDPTDVNDQRIVVDQSFTAKTLDLNTMTVEDLGVPEGSYLATRAEAINNSGVIAGAAILSTGSNCDHQAARHTEGEWQILSICGQSNSAYEINALGDVIMQLNVAVWVNLVGLGNFEVEDLIANDVGHWFVINSYGNALNSSRQIAVLASNSTTGESGAILLTPEGGSVGVEAGSPQADRISAAPNPFAQSTTIRFDAPRIDRTQITIHDVSGRLVRTLVNGNELLPANSVSWDGLDSDARELPSGVYFARIRTGAEVQTEKLIKLK
jgi:hypothetical protein